MSDARRPCLLHRARAPSPLAVYCPSFAEEQPDSASGMPSLRVVVGGGTMGYRMTVLTVTAGGMARRVPVGGAV